MKALIFLLPAISFAACPPSKPLKPGDFFQGCDSIIEWASDSVIRVRDTTPEEKAMCKDIEAHHVWTECEVRPKWCKVGQICSEATGHRSNSHDFAMSSEPKLDSAP
jgi:hypothetical protein